MKCRPLELCKYTARIDKLVGEKKDQRKWLEARKGRKLYEGGSLSKLLNGKQCLLH